MEFLSYFANSISSYIKDVHDVPFHAYDDNLVLPFIHSYDLPSPKIDLINEGTLVQKGNMDTSFKDLPPKDESLENCVPSSPKKYLPHKDYLVQEDDIMATYPSDTIPSFHDLPSKDEALITYDSPFPNECLEHKDTLEQEDDIISHHNALSPKNQEPNKNQINSIHVPRKPKILPDYHVVPYTYTNEVVDENISEASYAFLVPTILSSIHSNTPSPTKEVPKEELLEDDWGSLDFTPTFSRKSKMPEFHIPNFSLNTNLEIDWASLNFNPIPPKS